jgi:integrase
MNSITTKTARAKLVQRREPYWLMLGPGRALGFRAGPGTWIARLRTAEGKQQYKALDDLGPDPDYGVAKAAAECWFVEMARGARRAPKRGTVRDALAGYLRHLRSQGRRATAREAGARFNLVIDDGLGRLKLESVTRDDSEAWRNRLKKGRQPRSLNRHVRAVSAALNLATKQLGHTGNPAAWTLTALSDDTESAGEGAVFLTADQRGRLIAKSPKHLAALLTGLQHTGARPSELADATVSDFDAVIGTLTLRCRKGRAAKVKARGVVLSTEGAAFFSSQAKGKLAAAPLVASPEGAHWRRHEWAPGIREAIGKANEKTKPKDRIPVAASAYSFRHARISELLQHYAVDPLTVAQQCGTSLSMMQLYYFKFIPRTLRAKLDAVKAGA